VFSSSDGRILNNMGRGGIIMEGGGGGIGSMSATSMPTLGRPSNYYPTTSTLLASSISFTPGSMQSNNNRYAEEEDAILQHILSSLRSHP
jgi:hypothetical protein